MYPVISGRLLCTTVKKLGYTEHKPARNSFSDIFFTRCKRDPVYWPFEKASDPSKRVRKLKIFYIEVTCNLGTLQVLEKVRNTGRLGLRRIS